MGLTLSRRTPSSPRQVPQLPFGWPHHRGNPDSPNWRAPRSPEEHFSVFLHVYYISGWNAYLSWCGLGSYHSGVEVQGDEFTYAISDSSATGIHVGQPMKCPPGSKLKCSINLGVADITPVDLAELIENMGADYPGNSYDPIYKNSNHFSNDLCQRLIGKRIPGWVNRFAQIGALCSCFPIRFPMIEYGGDLHSGEHSEAPSGSADAAANEGEGALATERRGLISPQSGEGA